METTYLEAIRQGIWEEMERDPNVFLIGEDLGVFGGAFKVTAGMLDHFGENRVIDTPIAESAIVGAAIGASMMGLRPVAEIQFADFITCAFDQVVNFAAKCRYRWGAAMGGLLCINMEIFVSHCRTSDWYNPNCLSLYP